MTLLYLLRRGTPLPQLTPPGLGRVRDRSADPTALVWVAPAVPSIRVTLGFSIPQTSHREAGGAPMDTCRRLLPLTQRVLIGTPPI